MQPHEWDENEKQAWATWSWPDEFFGEDIYSLEHNLKALEAYVKSYGYYVEWGLLDTLVRESTLRSELRLTKPVQRNLGDVLVQELQKRPLVEEPVPFTGDAKDKLIEAKSGDILRHDHPSFDERQQIKHQIDEVTQQAKQQIKDEMTAIADEQSKIEAESMIAVEHGRIHNRFTQMLRAVFAKRTDGTIDWQRTLKERQRLLTIFESRSTAKPAPPLSKYDAIRYRHQDGVFTILK